MDPHTTNVGREACHASRDSFLACVEQYLPAIPSDATVQDAEKLRKAALAAQQCAPQRAAYDSTCLPSWRSYWDDRFAKGRPILGRK